jgi:glycyl-tRNA synthetase beta chain
MAPDEPIAERLMPTAIGLDPEGKPTPALLKKLSAKGLDHLTVGQLNREHDGKVEQLVYRDIAKGGALQVGLESALQDAVQALPVPKLMSYQLADGVTTVQFVRPVHGLVALHGAELVNVSALGLSASRVIHGHRFQGKADIELACADEYEAKLRDEGKVIASFDARKAEIEKQLTQKARELGAMLGDHNALLDEVTALVEYPAVYVGEFEHEFLEVPQECLILTMQQNQKYFPLFDAQNRLTNRFLIVSNMELADPSNVVGGNQRVIRPRLADARFFFEQDKKVPLGERVPQLASIVYHNKLGSQLERVARLQNLAAEIAQLLGASEDAATRAAYLAKADLVTLMVGEFPELQGTMGSYYARHDGEDDDVAAAIAEHYLPRYAGDRLPNRAVSICVALADKLETLAGMFGIGQLPTGDKDPLGLRRAALGIIRIVIERQLSIELTRLIEIAFAAWQGRVGVSPARDELENFIYDRLRGYLREGGYTANEVESVVSQRPSRLDLIPARLAAVKSFRVLPEAESLAAANKRIQNILKKSGYADRVDATLFVEDAERSLHAAIVAIQPRVLSSLGTRDYTGALKSLASMKAPVDTFFDKVLVNAEDAQVRTNRLALLTQLERLMNQVADISKLAT